MLLINSASIHTKNDDFKKFASGVPSHSGSHTAMRKQTTHKIRVIYVVAADSDFAGEKKDKKSLFTDPGRPREHLSTTVNVVICMT